MRPSIQIPVDVRCFINSFRSLGGGRSAVDPAHTSFGFTVKHMMISHVPGEFDKFEGQIIYSSTDLAGSKANVTIDVSSINTRIDNVMRI